MSGSADACTKCGVTWRALYNRGTGDRWCMNCIHRHPTPVRAEPVFLTLLCTDQPGARAEHDRCTSFRCECPHHNRGIVDQRGAPTPVPIRW